ncbi:M28 family metallopeptidase [Alkaliphilus pronyensis]|uniref:M28 family metallopeptidase n=1 Tax=Alkaliphilus pronyensis TaxID=1482732 RepID=UPI0018658004|nr:M28 family metallopeptidase [Alkaliphilus pronyensis]
MKKYFSRNLKLISILTILALMVGCTTAPASPEEMTQSLNKESIDITNTIRIIEELSSEDFDGRLTGTKGNELTVEYIENYFKKIGLDNPTGIEGYRQSYDQKVLLNESKPMIAIKDGMGNITKEFGFLSDYRKMAIFEDVKIQGEATAEMIIINNFDEINNDDKALDGKILLISNNVIAGNPTGGYDILQKVLDLEQQVEGIIVNLDNRYGEHYLVSTSLRYINTKLGEGFNNKTGPIMAYFHDEAFEELTQAAMDGNTLHMKVDYSYKDEVAHNVIGVIPGSDEESQETLIIAAHLDHVGNNQDGTYNPGALDNASGTAAIMEIARMLKSEELQPKKTIIFIAFNGEEQYLCGSTYYVRNSLYPLANTTVINLDMVGSKEVIPLTIGGSSNNLNKDLYDIATELGIDALISQDIASDQRPFNDVGLEATTLIHLDTNKIHTKFDTIENVDKDRLANIIKLVLSYIEKTAY